jgi:hypothetical protein
MENQDSDTQELIQGRVRPKQVSKHNKMITQTQPT